MKKKRLSILKFSCILFAILFFSSIARIADRDFLWKKVNKQCVPHYIKNNTYSPCSFTDLVKKYVIYKTDFDKNQFLLMPTDKNSGLEDRQLLHDKTPNYLYYAWKSRTFLINRLVAPLKDTNIALTLNAKNHRSQDQLHIHISCLSPMVRKMIRSIDIKEIGDQWSKKTIGIKLYSFYYKKISLHSLKNDNIFKIVKDKIDTHGGDINAAGMALVNIDDNSFLILLSSETVTKGVWAEIIQDHQCHIAHYPALN